MSIVAPRLRRATRTLTAGTAVALLGGVTAVLLAAPAQAHVTVGSDDARQGASDAVLTFRVPNEQASGVTTKVTISFPKATPLAEVLPANKPGWTFATTKVTFNPPITTDDGTITDGVSQVVYSAGSPTAGIPVGGFDTFQVLVGPLPAKAPALAFPVVQTYSDGKTVSWVQPVTDPANEPDFPAPTLALLPAGPSTAPAASAAPTASAGIAAVPVTAPVEPVGGYAGKDDVGAARTLGVTGIVIGILGLATGAGGMLLGRRGRG